MKCLRRPSSWLTSAVSFDVLGGNHQYVLIFHFSEVEPLNELCFIVTGHFVAYNHRVNVVSCYQPRPGRKMQEALSVNLLAEIVHKGAKRYCYDLPTACIPLNSNFRTIPGAGATV